MKQAAPATQHLARQLLANEATQNDPVEPERYAALNAFTKLRSHLAKLVGVAGFQALMSRALALAKREADWLESVRVESDATLKGFEEAARLQSADAVLEGSTALLSQLLGLLITFIGEALTLRLVHDVWPTAQLAENNDGAEETTT